MPMSIFRCNPLCAIDASLINWMLIRVFPWSDIFADANELASVTDSRLKSGYENVPLTALDPHLLPYPIVIKRYFHFLTVDRVQS